MKKTLLLSLLCLMVSLGSCAQSAKKVSKKPVSQEAVVVKTLPEDIATDKILPTIISEFKDQVVVLDFWATWCGPCMMAMKQIDPVKDKYLGDKKPVAFVYITGETSPLDKWQAAIPSIKGYHYRLKGKQFNALLSAMGIKGIPTYYIADKKGACTYDNIKTGGYPGNEVITAQIEDALNKK